LIIGDLFSGVEVCFNPVHENINRTYSLNGLNNVTGVNGVNSVNGVKKRQVSILPKTSTTMTSTQKMSTPGAQCYKNVFPSLTLKINKLERLSMTGQNFRG
jgi:hypothetical protein